MLVAAAAGGSTFAITGVAQNKPIAEVLPSIVGQLVTQTFLFYPNLLYVLSRPFISCCILVVATLQGPDTLNDLKAWAAQMQGLFRPASLESLRLLLDPRLNYSSGKPCHLQARLPLPPQLVLLPRMMTMLQVK